MSFIHTPYAYNLFTRLLGLKDNRHRAKLAKLIYEQLQSSIIHFNN